MRTAIRVGIVDPHDIVRDGLKVFLETTSDLRFSGEAGSLAEACELCLRSDVIIFDFLNRRDCTQTIQEMLKRRPAVKVLVLSTNMEPERIFGAVKAGAAGYLFKQVDIDDLEQAIRVVHSGGWAFDEEIESMLSASAGA